MTDNVTPTQADIERADKWQHLQAMKVCSGTGGYPPLAEEFARHRLAAEATQAAEIARLRGAGLTLLRECERNGVADNVLAGLIPAEKLRDGSGMCESTKNLRRAMNEFRAALSAMPSELEDDDLPEQVGTCENCRAIIRDGDNYIMDDYCVCLCSACAPSEQDGGE